MTIATMIKFEVILMDTRKEMVSVNNLLKQTRTVYRIILQLPFTISTSSFISPASKYWGVLVLLVSVQILVCLDCFCHSITMEV